MINLRFCLLLCVCTLLTATMGIAQSFQVNPTESTVEWECGKVGADPHTGTIQVSEGAFQLEEGGFSAGQFIIDMGTIANTDLFESFSAKLIKDLMSDKFFSVSTYPEARLEILSSTEFVDGKATVQANATIKGHTEPVSFDVQREGNVFTTKLVINRFTFGVDYNITMPFGSGGIIDEKFVLNIRLVTL